MKKIFCWIDRELARDVVVCAICEDGVVLTNHISSNETWAKHDIGITSDWKHDIYKEYCPDGYELIWVENEEVMTHKGLSMAIENNDKLFAEEKIQ